MTLWLLAAAKRLWCKARRLGPLLRGLVILQNMLGDHYLSIGFLHHFSSTLFEVRQILNGKCLASNLLGCRNV
jgi:hypothetical protein